MVIRRYRRHAPTLRDTDGATAFFVVRLRGPAFTYTVRQFTARQKRLCVAIAVAEAAIAVVLIILRLVNVVELPVFIPLLLLLTAAALFAAAQGIPARTD